MIWTIIGAILIFSVIIFIHELGHFIAARIFKVKVLEFAIGMGPKIWKKQGKETLYSIRAIPVGGFCSMEGEDSDSEDQGAFANKPRYARFIILTAGAFMNVLLGFVIILCLMIPGGISSGGLSSTVIGSIPEGSPSAGLLEVGDRITNIDGTAIHISRDATLLLAMHDGSPVEVTVDRNGEKITQTITPVLRDPNNPAAGYVLNILFATRPLNPWTLLHQSFFETVYMVKQVFMALGMLISGQAGLKDMSGPVGVVSVMNTAAQTGGLSNFLYFAAFITVNIGVMNLLPLPALDGGRIFFLIIEAIRRKPIPPEKEGIVHFIGLVLLLGLMVLVTWNDIVRLLFPG